MMTNLYSVLHFRMANLVTINELARNQGYGVGSYPRPLHYAHAPTTYRQLEHLISNKHYKNYANRQVGVKFTKLQGSVYWKIPPPPH